MPFSLLFLIPLLIIGVICSYTDIKYGKIRNSCILVGLAWVFIVYILLGVYSFFYLGQIENINYFGKMLLNGFITLTVGYLLWHFRLWTAADAKLFTLYALLIPLEFYSKSYFPYFPSFLLLINVFIPLFLLLMIKASVFGFKELLKTLRDFKKLPDRETFKKIKVGMINSAKVYIVFIFVFVLLQLLRDKTLVLFSKIIPDPFLIFILLFIAYRSIFSFFSKQKLVSLYLAIAGGGYAVHLFFSGQTDVLLNILKLAFVFMVLVGFLRKLLDLYIEKKETFGVKIQELKEGMFPSFQNFSKEIAEKLGPLRPEGLAKDQIELIKNSFIKEKDKKLIVYKTFPFAPFMLSGAAITLITKDSILIIILNVFNYFF